MKEFFDKAIDYLRRLFMTVAAPMGIFLLSFTELSNLIGTITVKLGSLALNAVGIETNFLSVGGMNWEVVNALLPIAEMWAMLLIFIAFMSGVLLFRWLKSIIPTIAN